MCDFVFDFTPVIVKLWVKFFLRYPMSSALPFSPIIPTAFVTVIVSLKIKKSAPVPPKRITDGEKARARFCNLVDLLTKSKTMKSV